MRVRPKADSHLGWAFRPDGDTVAALTRGVKKLKDAEFVEGIEKPHYGGNLATELIAARKAEDKRRGLGKKKRRRRRMARKVTLKEIEARKGKPSSKKTKVEAEPKSNGKLIPLKKLCADMELDPKATRVKLRRAIAKGEIDFHDHAQRWEFTPAQAKEVRAFLAE